MKKLFRSFVIVITILFLLCPFSFGTVDFNEQIDQEDGSLFEKIIAKCIRRNCTDNL